MKISLSRFAVLAASGAMMFTLSCRKPCKDVVCENKGATREEGKECVCDCAAGFEGERCETYIRAKFVTDWMGNESCNNGSSLGYAIRITSGEDASRINIANIGDFGFDHVVSATVSGNSFTFEPQLAGGKTFEGKGTLDGETLTFEYTVSQGSVSYTCSGPYTKL